MSRKLTEAQREVLLVLARQDNDRDGALATPDVSRKLRRRWDDWAYGKLTALERLGFVARLGTTFSGGQCWGITPAGRAALHSPSPEEQR